MSNTSISARHKDRTLLIQTLGYIKFFQPRDWIPAIGKVPLPTRAPLLFGNETPTVNRLVRALHRLPDLPIERVDKLMAYYLPSILLEGNREVYQSALFTARVRATTYSGRFFDTPEHWARRALEFAVLYASTAGAKVIESPDIYLVTSASGNTYGIANRQVFIKGPTPQQTPDYFDLHEELYMPRHPAGAVHHLSDPYYQGVAGLLQQTSLPPDLRYAIAYFYYGYPRYRMLDPTLIETVKQPEKLPGPNLRYETKTALTERKVRDIRTSCETFLTDSDKLRHGLTYSALRGLVIDKIVPGHVYRSRLERGTKDGAAIVPSSIRVKATEMVKEAYNDSRILLATEDRRKRKVSRHVARIRDQFRELQ